MGHHTIARWREAAVSRLVPSGKELEHPIKNVGLDDHAAARTSGGTSSVVFARWSKIAGPEAASRPCNQPLTLPELRPTFGRKLLDRERGSARHCGLNLLAHLSLGRSGTPLRGGGVLFRHAASLSGMSQLTACAISTSQGTRSGSGRGMRPSANALASSMRFWGKVQGAGRSPALVGQPSPLGSLLK